MDDVGEAVSDLIRRTRVFDACGQAIGDVKALFDLVQHQNAARSGRRQVPDWAATALRRHASSPRKIDLGVIAFQLSSFVKGQRDARLVAGVMVAIDALQRFHGESEIAAGIPFIRAILHRPCHGRVPERVGHHAVEPGVGARRHERLIDATDRLTIPFDDRLFRNLLALPTAQVGQKTLGQPDRRLALFCLPLPGCASIENPRVEIDEIRF